ncbi:hypothetical protein BH23ACT2_BH23ACT2_17730 [soil metagenome]
MGDGAGSPSELLASSIAAIDEANAADPVSIDVDGVPRPKEVVHAERMTYWLGILDPDASLAQQLAARAHHLRRWVSPRSDYPEGRTAYLRWRADHKRRQASEVADLLTGVGVDDDTIGRVATIVAKKDLRGDPDVQTHEDALCLVFLELQLADVASQLGDDHTIEVLGKTAKKMSERGLATVSTVDLPEHARRLLARALAPDAEEAGEGGGGGA